MSSTKMIFLLLLGILVDGANAEGSSTCEDGHEAEPGSALLQVQRNVAGSFLGETESAPKIRLQTEASETQPANQHPITEEGWNAANGACCLLQSDLFIREYITSLGKELCDEGSLNGFLPFASCNTNLTFAVLTEYLDNASSTPCPWVMPATECNELPASCGMYGVYNPSSETRRRACATSTTVSPDKPLCCKEIEAFENEAADDLSELQITSAPQRRSHGRARRPNMHKRLSLEASATQVLQSPDPTITQVTPVDCSVTILPIQILSEGTKDKDTDLIDKPYHVKQLEIESGEYKPFFDNELPWTMTTPPFKRINSCGINPIDSIIYCALTIREPDDSGKEKDRHYLVRLDQTKIEFVAKVKNTGYSGTFSVTGTYYWGKRQMWFIRAIHTYKGYPSQTHPDLVDLREMYTFDPTERQPGLPIGYDMVAIAGVDLDDSGEDAEYLVALHEKLGKATAQITKARLETGFVRTWWQDVEFVDYGPKGKPEGGFGAAWNYNGRLFFANNGGNGVYEVKVDDIDVMNVAVPLQVKKAGLSLPTGHNDGVNCIYVDPPPFPDPGDCAFGFEEVEPVGATCPEGSLETDRPEAEATTTTM